MLDRRRLPELRPGDMASTPFDRQGRLWLARGDIVLYRTAEGAWHTLPVAALASEQPRRIKANPVGGVDIATRTTLWRVDPNEQPRALLTALWITDVWYYGADRFFLEVAYNAVHWPFQPPDRPPTDAERRAPRTLVEMPDDSVVATRQD